jgi:hypothetical protein
VSRLKTNTRLEVTADLPVPEGAGILSDRIGLLAQRMARARRNPLSDPVREITVRIATGKTIRLVTNDLDAPAEEIPRFTSSAGRSSCSSNGSSRT